MSGPGGATQSAVLVPVPAVEPVVAEHRRRLDPASTLGVPAHVTVIYPFVQPSELGAALFERLADAVRSVPAFTCSFTGPDWFDENVVWLRPEPDTHFRVLTHAVWESFPDYPPYGGEFDDVTPHVTVGQVGTASLEQLRAAAVAVRPHLPVESRVAEAVVMAGSDAPNSWTVVQRLPLGSQEASGFK
jgi:2'-5' RNA ligase